MADERCHSVEIAFLKELVLLLTSLVNLDPTLVASYQLLQLLLIGTLRILRRVSLAEAVDWLIVRLIEEAGNW